jgi:2-dehydro-3-deoxygluconokinase
MTYDVVTLGETMLRFTPPALRRLEQTHDFELHVGGSESNTSVGLARLGLKVAWLSRLTDNALGHIVARTIASHGADTSQVVWTPEDRVGLYFLEEGKAPRGSQVIYDRKDSAVSKMQPSDLPIYLFTQGNAKLFHTTGITLALSESAKATATKALELAKNAGWRVSFDVNYRAKLWTPKEGKLILFLFRYVTRR